MANANSNRLREIRTSEGIEIADLARKSGIKERVIGRVETADGSERLEIKDRLVKALNGLTKETKYATDEIFAGWTAHRRNKTTTKKGSAPAQ